MAAIQQCSSGSASARSRHRQQCRPTCSSAGRSSRHDKPQASVLQCLPGGRSCRLWQCALTADSVSRCPGQTTHLVAAWCITCTECHAWASQCTTDREHPSGAHWQFDAVGGDLQLLHCRVLITCGTTMQVVLLSVTVTGSYNSRHLHEISSIAVVEAVGSDPEACASLQSHAEVS